MGDSDTVRKHLNCSICLDIFKVPKTLHCLHTFCEKCLKQYICKINAVDLKRVEAFNCPLCRAEIRPLNRDKEVEDWAADFPTNHFIVSLTEDIIKANEHPFIKESAVNVESCVPCLTDNKVSKSSSFCVDCSEYLCQSCHNDHKKFKITRKHTILNANDCPNDASLLSELSSLDRCSIHPEENKQFKCIYHNTYICSLCATERHKKCEEVKYIENIGLDKEKALEEINSKSTSLNDSLEKFLSLKLDLAEVLERMTSNTEACLSSLIEKMKTTLASLNQDFLPELKRRRTSRNNIISARISNYLRLIEMVCKQNQSAPLILEHGSDNQKAIFLECLGKDREKIMEAFQGINNTSPVYHVSELENDIIRSLCAFEHGSKAEMKRLRKESLVPH